LMADDQPGWKRDRDKPGILFPQHIPEFIPISSM